MAFPPDSTLDPATAWAGVRSTAGRMKAQAVSMNNAASVTRRTALDFANALADNLATFALYTATPRLSEYAQAQVGAGVDIVAEYNTMRTQIIATQDWFVQNFPNTGGELRVYIFDGQKRFADINLTAPQLTSFKTQLQALIATVA